MSSYSVIYTTMPEEKAAKELGHYLVKNHLAACVNIIENVTSIYEWKHKMVEDNEFILLVKTRTDMVEKVMIEIKHHHPYDVPALYSYHMNKTDDSYASWVDQHLL